MYARIRLYDGLDNKSHVFTVTPSLVDMLDDPNFHNELKRYGVERIEVSPRAESGFGQGRRSAELWPPLDERHIVPVGNALAVLGDKYASGQDGAIFVDERRR